MRFMAEKEGFDSRAAALGRASFWTSTGRPFIAPPFQIRLFFAIKMANSRLFAIGGEGGI